MAEGQAMSSDTDERISEIRARHRGERISAEASAPEYCPQCIVRWPCDYGRFLARLDALETERDGLQRQVRGLSDQLQIVAHERDEALSLAEIEPSSQSYRQAEAERAEALLARAERNVSALEGVALNALTSAQQTYDKLVRMSWRSEVRLAQRAALAASSAEGES